MKIIDLLNKIANGEDVPKKIRFDNTYWNRICGEKYVYYINDNDNDLFIYFFRKNLTFTLNDEVEILEEENKIPEKLKWNEKSQHNIVTDNTKKTLEHLLSRSEQLKKSINEIIDYLKSKGE